MNIDEIPSVDEQAKAYIAWRECKEVEFWDCKNDCWRQLYSDYTLTQEDIIRLKPTSKPKVKKPLTSGTIRLGDWIKKDGVTYLVLVVFTDAITINAGTYTFRGLMDSNSEFSHDQGVTWYPCYVEE